MLSAGSIAPVHSKCQMLKCCALMPLAIGRRTRLRDVRRVAKSSLSVVDFSVRQRSSETSCDATAFSSVETHVVVVVTLRVGGFMELVTTIHRPTSTCVSSWNWCRFEHLRNELDSINKFCRRPSGSNSVVSGSTDLIAFIGRSYNGSSTSFWTVLLDPLVNMSLIMLADVLPTLFAQGGFGRFQQRWNIFLSLAACILEEG